jgi:hypothetical protein
LRWCIAKGHPYVMMHERSERLRYAYDEFGWGQETEKTWAVQTTEGIKKKANEEKGRPNKKPRQEALTDVVDKKQKTPTKAGKADVKEAGIIKEANLVKKRYLAVSKQADEVGDKMRTDTEWKLLKHHLQENI